MAGVGSLLKELPAFSIQLAGDKSLKNKKTRQSTAKSKSGRKKFRLLCHKFLTEVTASPYFFALCTNHAYATDMWTKADTIMKDVYEIL